MLDQVRAALPDDAPPEIRGAVPVSPLAGAPVIVRVVITDPSGVARAELVLSGEPPLRLSMSPGDGDAWTGSVPASLIPTGVLSFWIEAFDTRRSIARHPAASVSTSIPTIAAGNIPTAENTEYRPPTLAGTLKPGRR